MNSYDFLVRQNNDRKVFLSEDFVEVSSILNDEYTYILNSINDENFILKSSNCNIFKEITFDDKVVGFCTYIFDNEFFIAILNNIYILPEFRGNGLFYQEIRESLQNNKIGIAEPSRLVVECLVKYGFAKKIGNYVLSALEFIVPGYNLLSSDKSEIYVKNIVSHLYDLNICATFSIINHETPLIYYNSPLNDDIIRWDCLEARSDLSIDYFKKLNDYFVENNEFVDVIKNLENDLKLRKYSLEEVVGPEGEFSEYIESLIDDGHITLDKAYSIKQQIIDEYNNFKILNESLLTRLAFLFEEDSFDKTPDNAEEICPYCFKAIDHHDTFCHTCGYNLT